MLTIYKLVKVCNLQAGKGCNLQAGKGSLVCNLQAGKGS